MSEKTTTAETAETKKTAAKTPKAEVKETTTATVAEETVDTETSEESEERTLVDIVVVVKRGNSVSPLKTQAKRLSSVIRSYEEALWEHDADRREKGKEPAKSETAYLGGLIVKTSEVVAIYSVDTEAEANFVLVDWTTIPAYWRGLANAFEEYLASDNKETYTYVGKQLLTKAAKDLVVALSY